MGSSCSGKIFLSEKTGDSSVPQSTKEEEKCVEEFVEKNFDNVDFSFVPDGIEKEIYEKMLLLLMNNLKQMASSVKIEFLNHVITINITPISTP